MRIETTVCIVGGGPAGVMTGYLLARQGVPVIVLEKHRDFFRDFRGDTVHPSTLELFYELGLLGEFLKLPHQELTSVSGVIGGYTLHGPDFRHVPSHCKFVALMPQWDFLNFLSSEAKKFPSYDLRIGHKAVGLILEGNRIIGVEARTGAPGSTCDGDTVEIHAKLVVGCDGRHSVTRPAAHLDVKEYGVPIDVLWFRISRMPGDTEQLLGNVDYGRALILINRGDYLQAGFIVPKGSFEEIKRAGLHALQEHLRRIAPFLGARVEELSDWDKVSLLTVQINRLRQWSRPGVLCIGDAAHAMSPVGGVGINLAIQDAVATANLLGDALRNGRPVDQLLERVQQRREFPARATQFMQVQAHKALAGVFQDTGPMKAPWQLKVLTRVPGVQRLIGRIVGIGFRPEHVLPRQNGMLRRIAIRAGSIAGDISLTLRRV